MPTYQYVCTACDTPLEAVQAFSDPALNECPACSGRLRKVFSAVGVVFKGSGFYKNDSRATSKANGSRASAESSSSDGAGTQQESKREGKSEAKKESKTESTSGSQAKTDSTPAKSSAASTSGT